MPCTVTKSIVRTTEQVHMGGKTMVPLSWIRKKEEKINPRFDSYASLVGELIE